MILRIGYFLQGMKSNIKEVFKATIILFADNINYKADDVNVSADNNSNIVN